MWVRWPSTTTCGDVAVVLGEGPWVVIVDEVDNVAAVDNDNVVEGGVLVVDDLGGVIVWTTWGTGNHE